MSFVAQKSPSKTLLAVIVLGILPGCSRSDSLPNSVQVRGRVLYNGEPLPHGMVRFAPADGGGQPATGAIQDGAFNMRTTRSSPGVVMGNYRVSILSEKPLAASEIADRPPSSDDWPEAESLIPKKYGSIQTSGLELIVDKPLDNVQFDLQDN